MRSKMNLLNFYTSMAYAKLPDIKKKFEFLDKKVSKETGYDCEKNRFFAVF